MKERIETSAKSGEVHWANGLFLGLAGLQFVDAAVSHDGEKAKQALVNTGVLAGAGLAPMGAQKVFGMAAGSGVSTLFGLGFTGISAYAAIDAARDLYKGKQGAGYELLTSGLDTGAGIAATAITGLATMGKVARPFSRAALVLTLASAAAHLGPVTYSILEKTGVITAQNQSMGLETGRSVGSNGVTASTSIDPATRAGQAADGLRANVTQAFPAVMV